MTFCIGAKSRDLEPIDMYWVSTMRQVLHKGFHVAQTVKNLPATQETQVQSLDWDDPLEKGMATHFSILPWRIPWTEEPGGSQRVRHD